MKPTVLDIYFSDSYLMVSWTKTDGPKSQEHSSGLIIIARSESFSRTAIVVEVKSTCIAIIAMPCGVNPSVELLVVEVTNELVVVVDDPLAIIVLVNPSVELLLVVEKSVSSLAITSSDSYSIT